MHTVLWTAQLLLAVLFLATGTVKVIQPMDRLAPMLPWTNDFSPRTVRLIGAAEMLGALGLVLPAVTGIATVLTPLAATGLAVTMLLAAVVHSRRGEHPMIAVNLVLLAIAALVAWGRFGPYAS